MPTISLCMIVKNEEAYLEQCLKAVQGLVSEIIIVDTGSTDRSKKIAKKFGAKIIDFSWRDDFAAARNAGIEQATGDWILVLDADEMFAQKDLDAVRALTEDKETMGYLLEQRNYTNNNRLYGWTACTGEYAEEKDWKGHFPSYMVRLFQNKGFRYRGKVHEGVEQAILDQKGILKKTDIPFHHYGFTKGTEKIEEKREKYLAYGLQQIKETPEDPKPYYEVAKIYKNTGEFDKAIDYFKRSIALSDTYGIPYTNLGEIYTKQEKFKEAIAAYNKSIALKPRDENAYLNLGVLFGKMQRYQDAIEMFKKVLTINIRSAAAYHNLSLIFIKAKKFKAAQRILHEAYNQTKIDRFKKAADALEKKAPVNKEIAALYEEGKYDEVEALLKQALETSENKIAAYTNLGAFYAQRERYEDAVKILQDALKINPADRSPKNINLYANLAAMYTKLNQKDNARAALKKAIALDPPGVEFLKKQMDDLQ